MYRRKKSSIERFMTKETQEGTNAKTAKRKINRDKRLEMRQHIKVNEDTQHRQNIHANIHKLVQEGYSKQEILNELYKKFPDSKYKEYFSKWVEDKMEKNKKATKNKEERQI